MKARSWLTWIMVTLSSLFVSACFCLGSLDSVLRQPFMPFLTPTLTQNTPPILQYEVLLLSYFYLVLHQTPP